MTIFLVAAMSWGYFASQRAVTLAVNGESVVVRTHRHTVGALLQDSGIRLVQEDIVSPPFETPLERAAHVQVWLARPVQVEIDGNVLSAYRQGGSVADALAALQVRLYPFDRVLAYGQPVSLETPLSDLDRYGQPIVLTSQNYSPRNPVDRPRAVHLDIRRALPVTINDSGVQATIATQAATVGGVLLAHDIRLHPNDRVTPDLDRPVSAGLHISIERSKSLAIVSGDRTRAAHTRAQTVGEAVRAEGFRLSGKDYTVPAAGTLTQDGMQVQVVRVREELFEEVSSIPFQKLIQPDDNLEIDQQRLAQRGQTGEYRKLIRVVSENGVETRRVEKEWVARPPTHQITVYGRKIVPRTLMTPYGPVEYWRVVRMYATSYSAARAGVSPEKRWYGITRSGLPARRGIVAVDRSVVPWLSEVYVAGYGIGLVGDTGSGVKGKMIDLGFDDDNYESWHQWVDVYLLGPAPPRNKIAYILPNTPVEKKKK